MSEEKLECKYCKSTNMAYPYQIKKFGNVCKKHARQLERYGKIHRTRNDEPEIRMDNENSIAYITTYRSMGKGEDMIPKKEFMIDIDDLERVLLYRWNNDRSNHLNNSKLKIRLHRYIMNCPSDKVVDHINRNPLDNRKVNLRICTSHENSMNASLSKNNTSGVNGVYWDKSKNKWCAEIKYNYKKIFIGRYDSLEKATEMRTKAELKYFGEFRSDVNDKL